MNRAIAALLALLPLCGPVAAQTPPEQPLLDHPDAFERGFAVSFYLFDGCGDPLAGRMFRRVLAEKFAQCPFSAEARSRYQRRTEIQQAKVRRAMQSMIDERGGMPLQLDGLPMTCRQQRSSADYLQLRERLELHTQGQVSAGDIIRAPCDAVEIAP